MSYSGYIYTLFKVYAMYFVGYLTPDEKQFSDKMEYYGSLEVDPSVIDEDLNALGGRIYDRTDFRLLLPNLGWLQFNEPDMGKTIDNHPITGNIIFGAIFLVLFLKLAGLSGTPTLETIASSVGEMPLFKGGIALFLLYVTIRYAYSVTRSVTHLLVFEIKESLLAMFYILKFILAILFHREELIDNYRKIDFYRKNIKPDPVDAEIARYTHSDDDSDDEDGASPLPT